MQKWTVILAVTVSACTLILSGCGGGAGTTSPAPSSSPTGAATTTQHAKPSDHSTTPSLKPASTTAATDITTQQATTTTMKSVPNPFCSKTTSGSDVLTSDQSSSTPGTGQPIGWPAGSGKVVGGGHWCAINEPPADWDLNNYCALPANEVEANVHVMSNNLYWWNLYRQNHDPNEMMEAGWAAYAKSRPFDLMGFQECEDVNLVLQHLKEQGVSDEYATYPFPDRATAIVWRKEVFDFVTQNTVYVAEDNANQYYGKRIVQFVRLIHKASQKPVLFVNHHGPLSPATGGICGNQATAYQILKVIADNAKVGDSVILVGDFNAPWKMLVGGEYKWFEEAGHIDCHLPHVFGTATIDAGWGIDGLYSSCTRLVQGDVMPKDGSDHVGLSVILDLNGAKPSKPVPVPHPGPNPGPSGKTCPPIDGASQCKSAAPCSAVAHEGKCEDSNGGSPQCIERCKLNDYTCPAGFTKCVFDAPKGLELFAV